MRTGLHGHRHLADRRKSSSRRARANVPRINMYLSIAAAHSGLLRKQHMPVVMKSPRSAVAACPAARFLITGRPPPDSDIHPFQRHNSLQAIGPSSQVCFSVVLHVRVLSVVGAGLHTIGAPPPTVEFPTFTAYVFFVGCRSRAAANPRQSGSKYTSFNRPAKILPSNSLPAD